MAKVYIVSAGDYSDWRINKIFLNKEKAEAYHKICNDYDLNDIEEYDTSDDEVITKITYCECSYQVIDSRYSDKRLSGDYKFEIKYGNTAFEAYNFSPESENWNMFLIKGNDAGLIEQGKTMIKYRDMWAKEYCHTKGFATNFDGYKCFALNIGNCNSDYFKSVDNGDYDIFIPFCFDGKEWTYSLYSRTVDVSEIAKKYGGGGHKGASGFQSDKLLVYKI